MPAPPGPSVFDQRVELYDALIDWPKRLANEAPFYRHWFEAVSARRVLDAACGTGRHVAMFHDWGLEMEGADASSAMIDWCRRRHGQTADLRWVERSYLQPTDPPGRFDAVICVGNSLALSGEQDDLTPALAAMLGSLRPGGACIVQVLNLWRLPDGLTQYQKCVRVRLTGQPPSHEPGPPRTETEHLLLKTVRRAGSRAFIELVDVQLLPDGTAQHEARSDSFVGLHSEELTAAATAGGGTDVTLFGNYQREPYAPDQSPDLILVCRKA